MILIGNTAPLDDMILMPTVLKVLGNLAQTYKVVLLDRYGTRLRLQSPLPIARGAAVQLKLEGELLLGEVAASIPGSGHFEIWMLAKESLLDSWHPNQEWSSLDSNESVMGSLVALNVHLASYENWRCAPHNSLHGSLEKSS